MNKLYLFFFCIILFNINQLNAGRKRTAPSTEDRITKKLDLTGHKCLNQGMFYINCKDYEKAFPLIQEAAQKYQIPEAYLLLAQLYKEGTGCQKDPIEAGKLVFAILEMETKDQEILGAAATLAIGILKDIIELDYEDLCGIIVGKNPAPQGMYI
jgi:TPR repeat protein